MSAPERFQVGDTVRCVDGWMDRMVVGKTYTVKAVNTKWLTVQVDGQFGYWWNWSRFVLVSRPTPPALDPFAWDALALHEELVHVPGSYVDNIVAWSRFCYWAAQSNLAAHFLPTVAAARTRASNGRDVPPATVLVELPVDDVAYCASEDWLYDPRYAGQDWRHEDRTFRLAEACRRALGGGGAS